MFTRKYAPPSSFPLSSAMRGMLRCPRRPAEHFTIVWRDKGHAEMSEACRVRGVRSALRPRCPKCVTSEVSEACRIRGVWGVPRSRCATSEVCHVRGVPRPRCATPEVCHARGVPRPRCATSEVCHVRGAPRPRCAASGMSEVCHVQCVRGMARPRFTLDVGEGARSATTHLGQLSHSSNTAHIGTLGHTP